jgi:hypothetical protein
MAELRFDPTGAVQFDLGKGLVSIDRSSQRLVIPADLLTELCQGAGREVSVNFGQRLGSELGRRVAERLGPSTQTGSVELLVEHLGGDWALMGLGCLGIERWGRALVLTVEHSPLGSQGDDMLKSVLAGALQRALGRDVGITRLTREGSLVRFFVGSRPTAASVQSWLLEGSNWGDVLVRLHLQAQTHSDGG